jgi:integrase
VRKRARLAGLEPAAFAGHSLRSGFITEGGRRNLSILQLMDLSGHADMQTVKGYYQTGSVMANPAAHLADREK